MIGNDYVKALTRYSNAITSELTNKLAGNITLDLRPVVDPAGDGYASTISSLAKSKAIDGAQAVWLLTKSGYFPEDMPESTPANDPPELDQKGGDQ